MTPPEASVTIHYSEGQSLDLGPNEGANFAPSGDRWRDVFADSDILMLTGLERADAVPITSVTMPLLPGYDETAPATGEATAYIAGNVPGGMITAKALLRDGVLESPAAFQFHGAGGQEINNFLPGTVLYENAEHWLTQAVATWGGANE